MPSSVSWHITFPVMNGLQALRFGQMTDIENTGDLFFLMGIIILIWSTLLIFILHIKTQVFESSIIIDGLWTSRRVKIDLHSIEKVFELFHTVSTC